MGKEADIIHPDALAARMPRGDARWPNQTSTYTRAIL